MATAVQLELMVDEKGAVQGVRAFDAAIKGTAGTTSTLDATLKQLNTTLDKMAVSGAQAGRAGGRALHQMKEEGLSTKEGIHLVTEEFGIEMPRAFKNLIAQSSVATAAVKAVGSGIVALGTIQIGAMIFEQLYEGAHKLWEEHLSLTKAAEDYEKELEKLKEQDFGNTRSIATTELRIREATKAVDEYRRQADAAAHFKPGIFSTATLLNGVLPGAGGIAQWMANRSAAHDLQEKQFEAQREKDKLEKENLVEQAHEQRVAQIELNHAKDEELTKEQRITAELQKQKELIGESARYSYERESARGNIAERNPVATTLFNTGKLTPEAAKELQAAGEADAQRFELQKEQARQIAKLKEDALEAGLRGEALYAAQMKFAIDELKRDEIASVTAVNAVKEKFHNEQMKRLQAENIEIQKMREQTAAAGLTGIAKIKQEGQNKIADLYADNALTGKLNPGQLLAAANEIQKQTNLAIADAQRTFADQVDSVMEQSAERTMQGFARIHAEAQKQLHDLERDYREKGGKPEDLARGKAGIRNDEATQVAELQRHNADETAQIEAQARAHSLSAERQQTLAIQSEYQERLRQYKEELDQQLISEEDFNRRVAAAAQDRDAQMIEAAKQAREKMAGEFTRFFRDPMGALKEFGEKQAGELAASLVMRAQGKFPGISGPQGIPGAESWGGGILGRIAGLPKIGQNRQNGRTSETIASGAFTLSTAQIHIASAVISGVGGASGAPWSSAGSTAALALPGSFGGSSAESASLSGPIGMGGSPAFSGGGGTNVVGSAIGNVQQSVGLFKQAKGIFGKSGDSEAGDDSTLGGSGMLDLGKTFGSNNTKVVGPSGEGGLIAKAGGAFGGAAGLFSAYQGNGGFGGALGGAMSGMQFGAAIGGPIGAAVGLVGGAVLGAIGFGGREKARVYDLKTVRPRLGDDFASYHTGGMDYTSAYSDMQALDVDARKTLGKMGGSAKAYYWDTINKEIHQAEAKLTAEEKAGRRQFTMSAAQFDQGGWTGDFGSMATGPDTGWVHARRGEFVVHEQPAADHAGALEAIRAGASHADMARYYGLSSSAADYRMAMQGAAVGAGAGRNVTLNMPIHAIDTKDFKQRLSDVKGHVRSVLNDSYAENSGGSDAGF